MSPFKKSDRPRGPWYVWPTLPGFGRVGPWSTGLRNRSLATSVEQWLKEIAISDPGVVRGIIEGHYSLREAYVAGKEGRLQELRDRLSDPPLLEAIERIRPTVRDRRLRNGLAQLEELAPKGARLSWLFAPRNITDLLNRAAETRKINSVHRSLYAGIKRLLVYEVGKARKAQITADVVFAQEDDSRDVQLTTQQLRRLLEVSDPALRVMIEIAVLTGIDRAPLTRLTPAHIDFGAGTMRVQDTKAKSRMRTLQLSDAALAILRIQADGREQYEPLFDLNYDEYGRRFKVVRVAAGLPRLRIKDLRHVFATYWVQSGGSLKDLQAALGHTRAATTLRYTGSSAAEARGRMDAVADQLGLARPHLRIEEGGKGA